MGVIMIILWLFCGIALGVEEYKHRDVNIKGIAYFCLILAACLGPFMAANQIVRIFKWLTDGTT